MIFKIDLGLSVFLDMSLYLVSKLENKKLAMDTARQMEYTWGSAQKLVHILN
jgi:hypothetical protein